MYLNIHCKIINHGFGNVEESNVGRNLLDSMREERKVERCSDLCFVTSFDLTIKVFAGSSHKLDLLDFYKEHLLIPLDAKVLKAASLLPLRSRDLLCRPFKDSLNPNEKHSCGRSEKVS